MKTINYACILFVIMLSAQPVLSCSLSAGYDDEVPYHYINAEGDVVGTDADFLLAVFEKLNCKISFKRLPWKRTLLKVETGNLDIAIGAKYLDQRAKFAYYSAPYKSIQHWLYVREGEYQDIKSIKRFLEQKKVRLGVMRGWGYPPRIANVINNSQYSDSIVKVNTSEQLIKMLDIGRLDGMIFTPDSLKVKIKEAVFEHKFNPIAFYEEKLHFLFSKKSVNAELVSEFNALLFKLTAQGEHLKITEKYNTAGSE